MHSPKVEPARLNGAFNPASSRAVTLLIARFLVSIAVLVAAVAAAAHYFAPTLEAVGHAFVRHFGYAGMALGTALADGFHLPVPPPLYMLITISSGASIPMSFLAISCGSLIGGTLGYRFAERLSRLKMFTLQQPIQQRLQQTLERAGYTTAFIASVLPVPYSLLCTCAGLSRLPGRVFVLIAVCRIPKLALYYYLVFLGWSGFVD